MSMLENVTFLLFGVLQTIGIILYPLCWVLHEEWVWLEIPTQIFQHPLPAVTGDCFTLFYFTQHKVSVTTWRVLTNQLILLPLYLFQGPVSELELCILMTGLACMQPHQIPKPCYLQYYNVAAKINANVPGSVQDPSGIPLFPVCVIREKLF